MLVDSDPAPWAPASSVLQLLGMLACAQHCLIYPSCEPVPFPGQLGSPATTHKSLQATDNKWLWIC